MCMWVGVCVYSKNKGRSVQPAMYPTAVIHGTMHSSYPCDRTSSRAPIPPVLTTNCVNSKLCLTMSRTRIAAFRRTFAQGCAMCNRTLGKISPSTTTSANSVACRAIAPATLQIRKTPLFSSLMKQSFLLAHQTTRNTN